MCHQELITELVKEYSKKDEVLGVILFGSHALGIARSDSDVDLYIITDKDERIIQEKIIKGVKVGFNILSLKKAANKIIYRSDPSLVRNFKEGKILYSREPSLPLLKNIAETLFSVGANPENEVSKIFKRQRLFHLLKDLKSLVNEDQITALYTMNFTFNLAIEVYYRFNCWTRTKRTYVIKELAEGDNFLHQMCKDYLHQYNIVKKFKILEKMIKYILEPHGGFLPEEWEVPVKSISDVIPKGDSKDLEAEEALDEEERREKE